MTRLFIRSASLATCLSALLLVLVRQAWILNCQLASDAQAAIPAGPVKPQPVSDVRVLAVLPAACGPRQDRTSEEACLAALAQQCEGFATKQRDCFTETLKASEPCQTVLAHQHGDSGYKDMYLAAFRRSLDQFQALGWQHFTTTAANNPSLNASLAAVDVIITAAQHYRQHYLPGKRYVLVDDADSATLRLFGDVDFADPAILAVIKPVVLQPDSLQRYPIAKGKSHYALITADLPHAKREELGAVLKRRSIPDAVLRKTVALMPHVWLWRFPLECGGKPKYLRFTGFFRPDLGPWPTRPLAGRRFDVAFMGSMRHEGTPVYYHRLRALEELQQLKRDQPKLKVIANDKVFDYLTYTERLRNVKILVSPYGYGEYALRDYEGWLSGAVVIKPRSDQLLAYPDLYRPLNTVYNVAVNFTDLRATVLRVLSRLDEAQAVVDRAQALLRQYADPAQFARDFDKLLRQTLHL